MPYIFLFTPAGSTDAEKASKLLKKHKFDFARIYKSWDSRLMIIVEGQARSREGLSSIKNFVENHKDSPEFKLKKKKKSAA